MPIEAAQTAAEPYEPLSFAQLQTQRDPFPFVARLLTGDRVYWDPITGLPIVTRYADIAAVLGNTRQFSSQNPLIFGRPDSPVADEVRRRLSERGFLNVHTLVTNDPPSHTRHRALVDRVFSVARVKRLESHIAAITDTLINDLSARTAADLIADFALLLPLLVITGELGVPKSDWRKIKFWSDLAIERISPTLAPERELEITDHLIEMQQYIWARAREADAAGSDTLLGLLARAEIDGQRLAPEELINMATQLFVAGHETTTAVIGHAALMLLDNPELRARLAADHALIPAFIEEALRMHPPVGQLRIAAADTQIAGAAIPKGTLVTLCALSGNHDPEQFPNPWSIDLARRNGRHHLAFGRGIHYCIGNLIARAEARIAIECLLTRLPDLRLDPSRPRPHYAEIYHSHALAGLPVVLGTA